MTTYDEMLKVLVKPVSAAAVPVIREATEGLEVLTENVDVLSDVADGAVLLASVLAGRLAASLTTSSAALVRKSVASQQALLADKAKAAQALVSAKSELIHAQQVQAGAQRQLAAARTDYARAAAIQNLARANATAIVAERAHTAALSGYNVAASAASVTTRALSGAMALLGGPIGIITTAAIALTYFSSASNDAELSAGELTSQVKDLTDGYRQLNLVQLGSREASIKNKLDEVSSVISSTKERIAELQEQARDGIFIRTGVSAPLSPERQEEISREIAIQNGELDKQQRLLSELEQSHSQIQELIKAGGNPSESQKEVAKDPFADVDYSKGLEKLEQSLQTKRERIQSSFDNQKNIIDAAYAKQDISDLKHAVLQEKLERRKQQQLTALTQEEQKKRDEAVNEARQKELDDIDRQYEARLRLLKGFATRKEQIEYELQQRLNEQRYRQTELEAQGFNSEAEQREHQHQERMLDIKFRGNSQIRDIVFSRAEWERKTEFEKTQSVIDIGAAGFKAFAGQSKKAFAAYKVFSIAKAVMNTYEMATSAYNAMASIPYIGPALGAAAAAAAIGFGLAQVRQIKSQKYSAAYHGGRDYVPSEQTALLQQGERVVSPRQNVALTSAVDKINKGQTGGGNVVQFHYNPVFELENTSDDSLAKLEVMEQRLRQNVMNEFVTQLNSGTGPYYTAVRSVA